MTKSRRAWAAVAAVSFLLTARAEAAVVVLPRPGQVGLGVIGQYGSMFKSGEIGRDFGAGPGFGVRLRYRMRYERAMGLTFESQGFNPRVQSAADTAAKDLTLLATGFEVYQMFGTRTRTTRMLSAGVGLAHVYQKLNDNDILFSGSGVGDGPYASLGGELEYFFWQSWAVDASLRYHAVFLNSTVNHDVQFAAGLIFYASY